MLFPLSAARDGGQIDEQRHAQGRQGRHGKASARNMARPAHSPVKEKPATAVQLQALAVDHGQRDALSVTRCHLHDVTPARG